jgi:L-aspartate oxidase
VTDLLPVGPAAHYLIGGVATDLFGRSSLPGLYAAGECAATGVHGANRMAGNSLSEAVVFGRRCATAIAGDAEHEDPGPRPGAAPEEGGGAGPSRADVVAAVTAGAGPVRDAASAESALAHLEHLAEEAGPPGGRAGFEAAAMVRAGRLLVRAALARAETRGVHVRSDHPDLDPGLDGVHLVATAAHLTTA